jgi:curved DNA-binding protein CbpA
MNRVNRRNYYRILHVQPDAPAEVIKSSYRTLMQRLRMHPDLGGDHWNASLINEAYTVLMDPDQRAAYDREQIDYARDSEPAPDASQAQSRPAPRPKPGARTADHCPFCRAGNDGLIAADTRCPECASPLAHAEGASRDANWLRAIERVPKSMDLRVWTDWPQRQPAIAQLRDLSLTGVGFELPHRLALNTFVKLDSELFASIARVVRSRESGRAWEHGAEFYTLRFKRSRGGFVSAEA